MGTFKKVFVYVFCIAIINELEAASVKDATQQLTLTTTPTNNGIKISIKRGNDNTEKLKGTIGIGYNFEDKNCESTHGCKLAPASVMDFTPIENGFHVTFESTDLTTEFKDCYALEKGQMNWYGGPEKYFQDWPVEKLEIDSAKPYTILTDDNTGVAEPYWLNSRGSYIYVDRRTPLFVDQNKIHDDEVCFIAKIDGPYVNRERVFLNYTIIILDNPKDAHLHAVNTFLKKPTAHPDESIIREPIWTTWAKYKSSIDDKTVVDFAQDIVDNGYTNGGQLEIDDDWEGCYGLQEFKTDKFADISNTVSALKNLNFSVSIWIHPFVNDDCQNVSQEGKDNGYFVKNVDGDDNASWWNGNNSHQIDFTNEEARNWFLARLNKLQENPGIDSFKFDAGETNFVKQPAVYKDVDIELVPNIHTEKYVRTVAEFGNRIEVRSASHTQDLPIFVRMLDKSSTWGRDNGLYTLITTLLQMNMNGYTMVLPDMIGGNGYDGAPSAELLVRWAQATTFMPTMQFSYLPWDITSYKFNVSKIIEQCVARHARYADGIIAAMNASITNGTPVNPPIWWIAPTDERALKEDTEYLLGERILVAPVIEKGAESRDVYLPAGVWIDVNHGTIYEGPVLLDNYPAPIDILPFFFKRI